MTPERWRERRPLGSTDLQVTGLGLGGGPIGNLFSVVSDEDAEEAVDAAWDAGIRYFDTAPLYGHGLSERRLGRALRNRPRDEYVLSTKVGRLLGPAGSEPGPTVFEGVEVGVGFDFSNDGVLRSLEASLERLGTDRIDVALVHDPDDHETEAVEHAFPTLVRLRDEGVVGAIGCGMNQWQMLERFVEQVDLDCVLLAGRYSLLDRSGATSLMPLCHDRGIGVVLGGVFNSGILADPDGQSTYDYKAAPSAIVEAAGRLRSLCRTQGVPLAAAALQFAMRHPAVTTVLVGTRSAEEMAADAALAELGIGDHLWDLLQ